MNQEIRTALYSALCACFGLPPSSAQASVLIREAYQEPENARKIRAFLFLDGSGLPRSILRKAGIRPVPDPPEPLALHEPEGSLWRLRADLTVSLRMEEKLTHPAGRYAVAAAPAVVIHPNK